MSWGVGCRGVGEGWGGGGGWREEGWLWLLLLLLLRVYLEDGEGGRLLIFLLQVRHSQALEADACRDTNKTRLGPLHMVKGLQQVCLTLTLSPAAIVFCGFIWMPSTVSSSYVKPLVGGPLQLPAAVPAAVCWRSAACEAPLLPMLLLSWLGCGYMAASRAETRVGAGAGAGAAAASVRGDAGTTQNKTISSCVTLAWFK